MAMVSIRFLVLALAAAAPALAAAQNVHTRLAPGERVIHAETVTGRFVGWEQGDYIWARLAVPGRREELRGNPGASPIEFFLEANRGQPITVQIALIRMNVPEAGGWTNLPRITAARNGQGTAEQWWHGLNKHQRDQARSRFDHALTGDHH
jgi:hypothetical protein